MQIPIWLFVALLLMCFWFGFFAAAILGAAKDRERLESIKRQRRKPLGDSPASSNDITGTGRHRNPYQRWEDVIG